MSELPPVLHIVPTLQMLAPSSPGFIGDYELLHPLGKGGMASIYAARRFGGRNEPVIALKMLDAPADMPDAYARFIDEARVLSLLAHKHIAAVYEVVTSHHTPYMVMELVDGFDLRVLLNRCIASGCVPSLPTSLSIVRHAALGLDYAHRRKDKTGKLLELVHRDVSLSNIMVTFDGSVKVVDFGIARSTLSTVHTLPGLVRGKPSYMAPEQCIGRKVTHLSDVFALGIVLYELATGTRCFAGDDDIARMRACVRGEYSSPSTIDPTFPRSLERVIVTALQADPQKRYPSCAALNSALDRVADEFGWTLGQHVIASTIAEAFAPEMKSPGGSFSTMARDVLAELRADFDVPTPQPVLARGSNPTIDVSLPFEEQITRGYRSVRTR